MEHTTPDTSSDDDWYTTRETTERLGICANTLRKWWRLGLIERCGSDGSIRYPHAEVARIKREPLRRPSTPLIPNRPNRNRGARIRTADDVLEPFRDTKNHHYYDGRKS